MERWRQPVIPIFVDESSTNIEVLHSSGLIEPRVVKDVELILKDADVRRILEGRVCIYCQEPFEVPFPDQCPLCAFPVKEKQLEAFGKLYNGREQRRASMEDKLAAMEEAEAEYIPKPQIVVPRAP